MRASLFTSASGTRVVFLSSIVLAALAIGLLVASVVAGKRRKLLAVIAIALLVYAGWRAITATGFLGGLFFIAGSVAVLGAVIYWTMHLVDRFKSRSTAEAARITAGKKGVLGRVGIATTPLRPTGTAEIDGTRLPVSTEGEFIAQGSYVRVVAKDRKQYFVRLAEPSEVVAAVSESKA